MVKFNPQEYWESRLKKNFNHNGVGDIRLGESYNNALYKIRDFVFFEALKDLNVNFQKQAVLDVGSGTGFYIERWKKIGVKSILGSDITKVVVEKLANKYYFADFIQLDIGSNEVSLPRVDVISAFDVLFHIVEDDRFEQAINNIGNLLNSGGFFIISDNFVKGETIRIKHQVIRSEEYLMKVIKNSGFELVASKPMFVLMNRPVDTDSKLLRKFNNLLFRFIRKGDIYGKFAGKVLIPIERMLIRMKKSGPSTKVKVFRKK